MRASLLGGLTLGLFALFAVPARAETYHVAVTGDDGAAGTMAAPFRTVGRGLDALAPGDTLLVHEGTYDEGVSTYEHSIAGGSSWETATVIAAADGESVTLRPPSGADRVFTLADASASFLVIRGFVMDATNVTYDAVKITYSGPDPVNSSHHIRIESSEVMGSPGQGLLVAGHDNQFVGLRVHDNGTTDFDHGFYITSPDNLVEGCEVYANAGWGVHVYNGSANEAHRNVIRRNLIHDNARVGDRGPGIILSSGDDNVAYDNVIFGNRLGIQLDYGGNRPRVYHNTIVANAGPGIYVGSGAPDADVRNNIVFDNASAIDDASGSAMMSANLTDDPLFVDYAGRDLHLDPASPAIDAAEPVAEVTVDYDGNARSAGDAPDIGAYEWGATSPTDGGVVGDGGVVIDGGTTTTDGGGTTRDGGGSGRDAGTPTPPGDDGGCGCRVVRARGDDDSAAHALVLALALIVARTRRSRVARGRSV